MNMDACFLTSWSGTIYSQYRDLVHLPAFKLNDTKKNTLVNPKAKFVLEKIKGDNIYSK